MKLVTFELNGKECVGILSDDEKQVCATKYESMLELIKSGERPEAGEAMDIGEVKILAPIPQPEQDIIAVGVNYKDHAEESAGHLDDCSEDKKTTYFGKHVNRAVAPGDPIEAHEDIESDLDYEAEFGIVIGKEARYVKAEDAFDYVYGYTIVNDMSARSHQFSRSQYFYGKGLDNFTPMGPCIVTEDEFERPPKLAIKSFVNGELRQNSNTELLIDGVAALIEDLSKAITLRPGTVIATGTPAGVGLGFNPPKYMKPGDVVRCEIEGIGVLENPVVASAELFKK